MDKPKRIGENLMKKIKCTECGKEINIKDLIISDNMNEGCNYFGHVISKKHLKEIKK